MNDGLIGFLLGGTLGLFLGCAAGIVITCLAVMAGRGDHEQQE